MFKITVLGTGTSSGIMPMIACLHGFANRQMKRQTPAAASLVEINNKPFCDRYHADFRYQMLRAEFKRCSEGICSHPQGSYCRTRWCSGIQYFRTGQWKYMPTNTQTALKREFCTCSPIKMRRLNITLRYSRSVISHQFVPVQPITVAPAHAGARISASAILPTSPMPTASKSREEKFADRVHNLNALRHENISHFTLASRIALVQNSIFPKLICARSSWWVNMPTSMRFYQREYETGTRWVSLKIND